MFLLTIAISQVSPAFAATEQIKSTLKNGVKILCQKSGSKIVSKALDGRNKATTFSTLISKKKSQIARSAGRKKRKLRAELDQLKSNYKKADLLCKTLFVKPTATPIPTTPSIPPQHTFTSGPQKILGVIIESPAVRFVTSRERVSQLLFGPSDSLKSFYEFNSRGKVEISGDVVGPIEQSEAGCFNAAHFTILEYLRSHYDLSQYQHMIWFVPWQTGCGIGGIGGSVFNVGTNEHPHFITLAKIAYPGEFDSTAVGLATHELGHSFGLAHSNEVNCFESSGIDRASCQSNEYGDTTSIMGGASLLTKAPILPASQREVLGWIDPEKLVTARAGIFVLGAIDRPETAQLKVPVGQVTNLFNLDYINGSLSYGVEYFNGLEANVTNQISAVPAGARISLNLTTPMPITSWPSAQNYALVDFLGHDRYQLNSIEGAATKIFGAGAGIHDNSIATSINILSVGDGVVTAQVLPDTPGCSRYPPEVHREAVIAGSPTRVRYRITNNDSAQCGTSSFTLETLPMSELVASGQVNTAQITPGTSDFLDVPLSWLTQNSARLVARIKNTSRYGVVRLVTDWIPSAPSPGCVRNSPTITMSPVNVDLVLDTPFNMEIKVRNEDSPGCGGSVFTLSFDDPRELQRGYLNTYGPINVLREGDDPNGLTYIGDFSYSHIAPSNRLILPQTEVTLPYRFIVPKAVQGVALPFRVPFTAIIKHGITQIKSIATTKLVKE